MNSNSNTPQPVKPATPVGSEMQAPGNGNAHPLTAAIQEKWSKLQAADLTGLKTPEELTAKIQARYNISADQASAQVKEWAVGRQF